jgi:glycosyltransferase involved in cell wall biosynthesis
MNIVILWTGVTAPMAACWRSLAASPGVQLTVFSELHRHAQTAYNESGMLAGLDHHLRYSDEPLERRRLVERITALRPDVMIVLGWRSEMCRAAVESSALAAVPKLLAFDLQFEFTIRKLLAPIALRRYIRRFIGAFVPGERSAEYARWLGFRDGAIERGVTGLDTALFAAAAVGRSAAGVYPRRFLYVGRYAPEKGLDVLLDAYRQYRATSARPWSLTCCGMGPEATRFKGIEGVSDLGFMQPADLPAVYGEHGAFVLASRSEPWGFVIQEAAAAGLPIVCTASCGAHVELVHNFFNGRVCGAGDVAGLTAALQWIHDHESDLAAIGRHSLALVEPYSSANWARRVIGICGELAGSAWA